MNSHSKNIRWTPRKVKSSWDKRVSGVSTKVIAAKLGIHPHSLRAVWRRFGYGSTKQINEGAILEIATRIQNGETLVDIAEETGKSYASLRLQLINRGLVARKSIDWGAHIDTIIQSRIDGVTISSIAELMETTNEAVLQAMYRHRQRIGVKLEPVWTPELVERAHALKTSGVSFDDISTQLHLVSGEAVRKKLRAAGYRYSTNQTWTTARLSTARRRLRNGESWRVVALDNEVSIEHLKQVMRKKEMLP